jgi:SAM-dependent methyltransferase
MSQEITLNNIKSVSNTWKKWADSYAIQPEPSIPSLSELNYLKNFINNNSQSKPIKVLILGSTPRHRDMLNQIENCEVFLCDINHEMTLAMSSLLISTDISNETWVKGSWTNLVFQDEYFDFILGDFTIENVPFWYHEKYINELHRVLKPKGKYFGCFYFFYNDQKPLNFELTRIKYGQLTLQNISAIWSVGVFLSSVNTTRVIRVQDFVNFLRNTGSDFLEESERISGVKEFYPFEKLWFTYNIEDFLSLINGKFQIQGEFIGNDTNFMCEQMRHRVFKELEKI